MLTGSVPVASRAYQEDRARNSWTTSWSHHDFAWMFPGAYIIAPVDPAVKVESHLPSQLERRQALDARATGPGEV